MAKSTIILADTDKNFLTPLEFKFLEELEDDAEIEIITDPEYFREYFSTPRSANTLLVSERLYSTDIQKHNINSIFVLTESTDDSDIDDMGITRIFKYTSTQEIFKEVTSIGSFGTKSREKKDPIIALIYSASGGVGKSTIALSLSAYLAKSYYKVLYINAQRINSFQHYLANNATIPNSVIPEFEKSTKNIFDRISHIIRNEGFDYLPPFSMAISSLGLDFSIYKEIAKSAKDSKKYDVIIIDTDTAFDKDTADLITLADKVIMVLNQNRNSALNIKILLNNIACNDSDKFYLVCNNFNENEYNYLISSNCIVNEYVKHFDNFDSMTIKDLSKQPDIQKVSYLIV